MQGRIAKVERSGNKITLDNNSVWWIFFPDSIKSLSWRRKDAVIVREMKDMPSWKVLTNTIYPYTTIIEHVASGKMVGAKAANDERKKV